MTYKIFSTGPKDTARLAAELAKLLQGGEVIELASDLGGGKTTFVQALAAALGYDGAVTSPTFTLSQIYALPGGRELHHYDLYRLGEAGIVADELAEDVGTASVITAIEWAGVAADVLPSDRLKISLNVTGDMEREVLFEATGRASERLVKGMQS
jgi:tRNA threonylcarbamoyladenosine biosynthesis protein TsaE